MGKKKQKDPAAAGTEKQDGGPKASIAGSLFLFMLMIAGLAALPTTVLFLVGLTPAIVAWITDARRDKYAAYCIGCFSLCGIMPSALELWTHGHSMNYALGILQDPKNLLVMYGAAGIGWAFYWTSPFFASTYIDIREDNEIESIKAEIKRLEEEWGDEVRG